MAFASPSRQPADKKNNEVLTSSVAISFALHAAVFAAILWFATVPVPMLPMVPIMVSMITAPTPEPMRPREPERLPKPKPVTHKALPPTPKPLLAASEKPVPVPEASAPQVSPPPAAQIAEATPAPVVLPPRFDASYLLNPSPPYPPMARRMGEQGKVMVRVLVSADGSAAQVELKSSSGSSRLDQSALDTVKRWRFVPAKQGTQAVTAWVLVPISFTLGG